MERRRRRYRDVGDYVLREDITDPNLLKDGERMRVPMMMADAASPDAHQPGHVRPTDAMLDAKEAAYRERAHDDENAWRTPPSRLPQIELRTPPPDSAVVGPNMGALPYAAGQEGDACTIDGAPGMLQMVDGRLVCVVNKPSTDAVPTMDAKEAAYRAYDQEQERAWMPDHMRRAAR